MAVIEHKEYKIICDNCAADVTEWWPAKNKTQAVRIARQDYGKPFKRGSQLCDECEQSEDMSTRTYDPDMEEAAEYFKKAKPVCQLDRLISNNK